MTQALTIRKAELRDADAIARFNSAMALETEGKALLPGAGATPACCAC